MKNAVKYCLLLLLLLVAGRANANHIYGVDFYYTYVTGNTYTITLIVYGDCKDTNAFRNLPINSPVVDIYRNDTFRSNLVLSAQSPTNGVEVTPVCPAQANNTFCSTPRGTLPGVTKFVYSGNTTITTPPAQWKFVFASVLGGGSVAGRSASITNVVGVGSTLIQVEAMLDRTTNITNSSPRYTTIPTPFFTQGKASSFNPGTVDPNGDSLYYNLVPGIDANIGGLNVTYVTGYTATKPISTAAGAFNFNNTNGQLDFTPNNSDKSLIVYRVEEYRNGVLIGTSMREMTFVILPGTNDPPAASMTAVQGGIRKSKSVMEACQGQVSFKLNPTDANGDNITITSSGLPAGATFTVTGNGSSAPSATFSWNAASVAPGTYTFFVTYTDDGCPLKSTQTQAYAVIIVPPVTFSYAELSSATCIKKAAYRVTTAASVDSMWLKILQSGTVIDSAVNTTGIFNDSLATGTYTIRVTNATGCYHDTTITIVNPVTTKFLATYDLATCNQYSDGAIHVTAISGTPPYEYALDAAPYGSNSSFTGLYSGTYMVHARDANLCVKDTLLILNDSVRLSGTMTATNVLCYQQNDGSITVNGTSSAYGGPYVYKLDGVTQVSNVMTGLPAATYIVRAQDVKGCYLQDTFTITEPTELISQAVSDNISCFGAKDGVVSVSSTGGTPAYNYSLNFGPYTTTPLFTGLSKGQYIVEVRDFNGCKKYDTLNIYEPNILSVFNLIVTHPNCFNTNDGAVNVLGFGGTPAYTYSAQGHTSTTGNITGLSAGATVVKITDIRGCSVDTTITLISPSRIFAGIGIKNATCAALDDGMITISGNGGFSPYNYAKDDSNFTATTKYTPFGAGTYTMRVKDGHGCIIDTAVAIKDSLYIYTTAQVTDASCYGNTNGSVTFTPAGGVQPYTLAFNNGDFGAGMTYADLTANTYVVKVKDKLGCMGDTTIHIDQPDVLVADTDVVYNNCYGNALVSKIALSVTGGTRPYAYTWSNGAKGGDSVLTGLANGSYTMYIQDAKGCKDTMQALLEYHDCCTPFIPSAFTPNGDGKNDVFRLVSKGDIRLKELQIFNRYGQRVFISNDIESGWNGSVNGSPADVGTYFYFLKAYCGNNNERLVEVKGDLTVIR
jgi:gliding motility-associated-like protein